MGKASRKKRLSDPAAAGPLPAAYVARPFAGLAAETDLVAMREILPAATMTVTLRPYAVGADGTDGAAGPDAAGADATGPGAAAPDRTVTLCSILPAGWVALRRGDGAVLVALQSVASSGDVSRDVAQALLAAVSAEAGTPVPPLPPATVETPRLQDLIEPGEATLELHDGFGFWVDPTAELDEAARASLAAADEAVTPTTQLDAVPSAYWCRMGERTYIRWVLPDDEDAATDALARLHAAGTDTLGEGTRLLGAFRAGGLLCPVWEVDPEEKAAAYEKPFVALAKAYRAAVARKAALTPDERRAKNGLLSRQLTLR